MPPAHSPKTAPNLSLNLETTSSPKYMLIWANPLLSDVKNGIFVNRRNSFSKLSTRSPSGLEMSPKSPRKGAGTEWKALLGIEFLK